MADISNRRILAVSALVVFLLVALVWLFALSRKSEAVYPIQRVISYSFEISNADNRVVRHADFWAYAPVKQTSTQRLRSLKVSEPYDLITDDEGNQIIHIEFKDFPPYGKRIVRVQAELEMSDTPQPVPLTHRQRYLQAEKYVEVNAPAIRKAAKPLQRSGTMATGKAIFGWVHRHIQDVGYVEAPLGALYALQKKKGDCTEYSSLYAALARADRIPSRILGGYVYGENTVVNPGDYHNWAEFYADGAWHIADAQKDIWLVHPARFITMNVAAPLANNAMHGFQRFRIMGRGLSAVQR